MVGRIGHFTLQMKNNFFAKDSDGTIIASVAFEGSARDFGAGFATLRVPLNVPGAKSGSCSWTGQAFPPGGLGWLEPEGTWEQAEG